MEKSKTYFRWQSAISLIKPSRGIEKPDFLTDLVTYLFILILYDSAEISETSTQGCAK